MKDEFYPNFEDEQIPLMNEMDLLEVMDICSNLYLTHLLAVEVLGYQHQAAAYRTEPLGGSDDEEAWISSRFLFAGQFFFRNGQIH